MKCGHSAAEFGSVKCSAHSGRADDDDDAFGFLSGTGTTQDRSLFLSPLQLSKFQRLEYLKLLRSRKAGCVSHGHKE